jgi:hypothetical protein
MPCSASTSRTSPENAARRRLDHSAPAASLNAGGAGAPERRCRHHVGHEGRRFVEPHAEPAEAGVDLDVHRDRPVELGREPRDRLERVPRPDARRQVVRDEHLKPAGQRRSVHQDRQRAATAPDGERVVEIRGGHAVHACRLELQRNLDDTVAVGIRLEGGDHAHGPAYAADDREAVRDRAEGRCRPGRAGLRRTHRRCACRSREQ